LKNNTYIRIQTNSRLKHSTCLICISSNLEDMPNYSEVFLTKCQECSFVFVKKIPSKQELIDFYDNNYDRTDYFSSITIKRYNELLDTFEKYRKTNNILDIGAGNGFFLEIAKARGWNVFGTELTDQSVLVCEKKDIQMKKGCLHEVGFDENQFDVITSFEVIEHINNPTKVVAEMLRILRDNGRVYITTPNFNSILRYRLKSKYDVIEYPNHLCYFTKKTLGKLFSDAGFNVKELKTTGISLTRIKTSKGKSNQEYVSETSDDEILRHKIENNRFLSIGKRLANWGLNLFSVGDSLKGGFDKKSHL